jgi:hypothetical protein
VDRYNNYHDVLKKKFSFPVRKIPVNAGFSCPNRDGKISRDGCAFCDNQAFSPVASTVIPPLEQFSKAAACLGSRYKAFIPYLQPFSNTYCTREQLSAVCEPMLLEPHVVGIAIGTRPDCITEEIYAYLGDLGRRTCLSVELGLQSGHDMTLTTINRGHTVADFTAAANELHKRGIEVVAHVILGLPGESDTMMFQTADLLASLPVRGVKLHQLMIVRKTLLESWHAGERVTVLEIESYASLLSGFLERLRPDQQIHRIMADSHVENGLIAPLWSSRKTESIRFLHEFMDRNDIRQGSRYR